METKKRVLVVDDEPGILHFVSVSLSAAGYEVITATNGEEGLRLAKEVNPDIMLLDVLMTPLTGFDVLAQLRRFSQLPVIVFTARNYISARAIQEGANEVITKPFKPEQLVAKIEETLGSCRDGA